MFKLEELEFEKVPWGENLKANHIDEWVAEFKYGEATHIILGRDEYYNIARVHHLYLVRENENGHWRETISNAGYNSPYVFYELFGKDNVCRFLAEKDLQVIDESIEVVATKLKHFCMHLRQRSEFIKNLKTVNPK